MEYKDRLKLSKKYVEYLSEHPENGMGYQIVNIELINGDFLKNRIVFNSEYLELNSQLEIKISDIKKLVIKS